MSAPRSFRVPDLAFWIEGYYNRESRHTSVGYRSPINYE